MALHGVVLPSARAPQACLPCRRAKIRCDGQSPACSGCVAKSITCVWHVPNNKRQQPREHPTSMAPASSTHVSTEPSFMEDSECVDEDDPCGLTNDEQHSMALTAPAPECPGKVAMYDKLIAVYFEKFHHHWPIVHEKSIRLRNVPQVLVKTVVTIGLYLTGNTEAQNMAKKTLEGFLHQSGNALAAFMTMGEAGRLAPEPEHLPQFQAILLQAIMIPRLTEYGLATGLMIDSMLSRVLLLAGIYDQSRINAASIRCDWQHLDPLTLRNSYQRLALFHFKFHAFFQVFCRARYPWHRISGLVEPSLLRTELPMPLALWDLRPISFPSDGATDSNAISTAGGGQLISDMCQMAVMSGDNKPLEPVDEVQPGLGVTLWLWLKRTSDDDPNFVSQINEFGSESFQGIPASTVD
ncbi:hypothetical protein FOCG_16244 [Fusarium oxysporum f. sp. radicis-lycopersici 26381]|nr:hypothetical protein FOCG_16244 [Fusarium oxysporum f. sp. radicis-lycopersici 26381]